MRSRYDADGAYSEFLVCARAQTMPHHASSCSADGRFIAAFGIQKKDERGDPLDRKFSHVQLFSAPTGELLKQFERIAKRQAQQGIILVEA